jgi:hypothetical protein
VPANPKMSDIVRLAGQLADVGLVMAALAPE